jgi:hypothetical protein
MGLPGWAFLPLLGRDFAHLKGDLGLARTHHRDVDGHLVKVAGQDDALFQALPARPGLAESPCQICRVAMSRPWAIIWSTLAVMVATSDFAVKHLHLGAVFFLGVFFGPEGLGLVEAVFQVRHESSRS